MAPVYYSPSGRVGASLLWRAPLAGLFAILAAWAYAWCGVHGNLFLSVLAPFAFSITMIVLMYALARGARVRNPYIMTAIALAICSLAWYANWIFWSGMHKGLTMAAASWHPSAIHAAVNDPALEHDKIGLWLAAAVEYIAFAALPALIGRGAAQGPYDEANGVWLPKVDLARQFEWIAEADRPDFIGELEKNPDGIFSQLQDFPADPARYTLLELHTAPGADHAWLTVEAVEEKTSNGKISKSSKTIVEHLRISRDVAEMMQREFAVDLQSRTSSVSATGTPEQEKSLATPSELESAVRSLEDGDFSGALAAATPYRNATGPQLAMDANRICALACSRLEEWSEAAHYWQQLFTRESTAHNALQIATSLVMSGQLAEGEEWIKKAIGTNEQTGEVPPVLIYTNFITALKNSGQLRAALPYLEWVKSLYQRLGVTDPTFLTMQGIPFFESFIEQSEPIVDASMDKSAARAWYAAMLEHLDETGQATLTRYLTDKRMI